MARCCRPATAASVAALADFMAREVLSGGTQSVRPTVRPAVGSHVYTSRWKSDRNRSVACGPAVV
jgi:hypothetical protein